MWIFSQSAKSARSSQTVGTGCGSDAVNRGNCSEAGASVLPDMPLAQIGLPRQSRAALPHAGPHLHSHGTLYPRPLYQDNAGTGSDVLLRNVYREEPEGTSSLPLVWGGASHEVQQNLQAFPVQYSA